MEETTESAGDARPFKAGVDDCAREGIAGFLGGGIMRDLGFGLFMALAGYVAPEDMQLQCWRGSWDAE